jgi:hypothetical protein
MPFSRIYKALLLWHKKKKQVQNDSTHPEAGGSISNFQLYTVRKIIFSEKS